MNHVAILGAKLKSMSVNAVNTASETTTILKAHSPNNPGKKPSRVSAAELNQYAEDAQIERAVQELAEKNGVTIKEEKPLEQPSVKVAEKRAASAKKNKQPSRKENADNVKNDVKETPEQRANLKGLYIHDYSQKSFAVFGNTKPVKDFLKKLGGRFNPCLHPFGADSNVPGWIFPIKARKDVESLISAAI